MNYRIISIFRRYILIYIDFMYIYHMKNFIKNVYKIIFYDYLIIVVTFKSKGIDQVKLNNAVIVFII